MNKTYTYFGIMPTGENSMIVSIFNGNGKPFVLRDVRHFVCCETGRLVLELNDYSEMKFDKAS